MKVRTTVVLLVAAAAALWFLRPPAAPEHDDPATASARSDAYGDRDDGVRGATAPPGFAGIRENPGGRPRPAAHFTPGRQPTDSRRQVGEGGRRTRAAGGLVGRLGRAERRASDAPSDARAEDQASRVAAPAAGIVAPAAAGDAGGGRQTRPPPAPVAGDSAPAAGGTDAPDADPDLLFSLPLRGDTVAGDAIPPLAAQDVEPAVDDAGMEFSEDAVLVFPDSGRLNSTAGTITFEIEPRWGGSDPGDNSLVQVRTPDVWENRLQLFRNGQYLRFTITGESGQEGGVGVSIDAWEPGERHTVAATWEQSSIALYIDGQLAAQSEYAGDLQIPPGTPLYVGSNLPRAGAAANARLQDFRIYGRPFGAEEVATRFAAPGVSAEGR